MGRPRREQGFTMIEIMIVVVIISLVSALSVPMYANAIRKSQRAALMADAKGLYDAMMTYHTDYGAFPSEAKPPERAFNLKTLAPLSTEGYLPGAQALLGKLYESQILLYLAPDVRTVDDQFIIVMRAAVDPSIILVVINTDIIHVDDNEWLDGVYMITDKELAEADEI